MKIVAIIPAHLNSIRFPRKVLYPIYGLPMIEHVRRRVVLSKTFSEVIVATCDLEISELVRKNKGKVIMTSKNHTNGTSRVAEATKNIDGTHIALIQGDEPLILPEQLKNVVSEIKSNYNCKAWNAIGKIENKEDLEKHSFVKCKISEDGYILDCFRSFSSISHKYKSVKNINKILGVIAYQKNFLQEIISKPESYNEKSKLIEQMRIIDNGYKLKSILIHPTLPSVNEPHEIDIVKSYIEKNIVQQNLMNKILEN